MIRSILSVRKEAWLLMGGMLAIALGEVYMSTQRAIAPATALFVVQPLLYAVLAVVAYAIKGGNRDRLRHTGDRAFMVGSITAVWFVLYFLSGLFATYTHNALVTGWRSVGLNIIAYGLTAVCIEYVRHTALLFASRRHMLWFGLIVAVICSLHYINIARFVGMSSLEDIVKATVANIVPGILASILLTYLAFTAGLPSQMVYQIATVAAIILPPVIPRYDWYLVGVSSVLLSLAVYIGIDRLSRDRSERHHRKGKHQTRLASDIMFVAALVGVVMFMSGFFAYRPLAILSNSMAPVFYRGSLVITERITDPMDVSVGDILQYESSGRVITHRVVEIDSAADGSGERVFITKGDNSPSRDIPVATKQILGIVRAQIPYVGYPTVWLRELGR